MDVRVRVLGPVEVDGTDVGLRPKEATVLCTLALNHPHFVPDDQLLEALWGEELPPSAVHTMRAYISRLRRLIGPDAIVTGTGGYRLALARDEVDAATFDYRLGQVTEAAIDNDPATTAERLAAALRLWRGEPVVDLHHLSAAAASLTRLIELRRTAEEQWAEAVLAWGQHRQFVGELERLAQAEPLRELRWLMLMTALVRSARHAEALLAYDRAREILDRELGIEPGPDLQRLVTEIGHDPPVLELAEPVAGSRSPVPPMVAEQDPLPFVGREAERQHLRAAWKAAVDHPRLMVIRGEAGIGKSRLIAELANDIAQEGGIVLAGRCDRDLRQPFHPFAQAMRWYTLHGDGQRTTAAPVAHELSRMVPALEPSPQGHWSPSDLDVDPTVLFDAAAEWFTRVAEDRRVLFILDDLHWATPSTLAMLRHLVRTPAADGLLVVAAVRPTELGPDDLASALVHELGVEPHAELLDLGPLDPGEVTGLLEATAGAPLDRAGWTFAHVVHDRTEGNPLLVRELLHHLIEQRVIQPEDGGWTTTSEIDAAGVPSHILDLVQARLARLSADANAVLAAAAVCGPQIEFGVLVLVAEIEMAAMVDALDESTAAGMLTEAGRSPLTYRFTHELLRTSVHDHLSAARRAQLHVRAAAAIERAHPATLDEWLPQLAHHYGAAAAVSPTDEAVSYASRAGQQALAQLAHADAAQWFERAVDLAARCERSDDRRRCDLLIALGDAQRKAGDPQHRQTLLDAGALADRLGDTDRLARAALASFRGFATRMVSVDHEKVDLLRRALAATPDEADQQADLLAAMSMELSPGPDSGDAVRRLADNAVRVARRADDPRTLLNALSAVQLTYPRPDEPDRRGAITAEMVALAGDVHDWRLRWIAHAARSTAAWQQGDVAEHRHEIDACQRIAHASRIPTLRWNTMVLDGVEAYLRGDLEAATDQIEQAWHFGRALGEPDADPWYYLQRWVGQIEHDQFATIRDATLLGLEVVDDPLALRGLLAWARLELGEPDRPRVGELVERLEADPLLAQQWSPAFVHAAVLEHDGTACAQLSELLGPWDGRILGAPIAPWGPAALFLGMLSTELGRFDEADQHFADCRTLCRPMGAHSYLAHNDVEMARMLLQRDQHDDREQAEVLLRQVLEVADANDYRLVTRRARDLLAGG